MAHNINVEVKILEILNKSSIEFLKKAIDMSFESVANGPLVKIKHNLEELDKKQSNLLNLNLMSYITRMEEVMTQLHSVQKELLSSKLEINVVKIVVALFDLIETALKKDLLDLFYKPEFLQKCRSDFIIISDRFNSLKTGESLSYYTVEFDEIMKELLELQKKVICPPVETVMRESEVDEI